ncbi:lipoprotein [Serratia rhizosphaerae]
MRRSIPLLLALLMLAACSSGEGPPPEDNGGPPVSHCSDAQCAPSVGPQTY